MKTQSSVGDGVSLREYVDIRFSASDKAILSALASEREMRSAVLTAQEKAVKLAEDNAALWRASANEWRGAMNDREGNFASRAEIEALKRLVYVGLGIVLAVQFFLSWKGV